MANFPTSLPGCKTDYDNADLVASADQNLQGDEINAIGAKVGVDSSAVTTSHSYKLSGVTGTDVAVSKTGVETLTNKTLTSPSITTPSGIVKGDVGLGNVDNTSDATKNAAEVTLTNKTLTAPKISTISNTGTTTLFTATDTLVGRATTDTLTNKSIDAANNTITNTMRGPTLIVDADTTKGDYTTIQAAIDALPAEGGKVAVHEGTYAISSTLTLVDNMILEGEGIGNTIIQQASGVNDNVINVANKDNWAVRDLSIDGNVANNASGDNGLNVTSGSNFLVQNVESYNNKLKGFSLSTSTTDHITDGKFLNCEAHTNGQDGIGIASGTTAGGKLCKRIQILNGYWHDNTLYGIGLITPSSDYNNTKDILVQGNIVKDNGTYGIEVFGTDGSKILNNHVEGSGNHGIDLGSATNVLFKVTNSIISGNIVKNGAQSGIVMTSIDDSIVTNNRCYDDQDTPTQTYGINQNSGSRNIVCNNDVAGNVTAGGTGNAGAVTSLVDADATPSVAGANNFLTANTTGATNVTGFDDGYAGQIITIIAGDANTTVVDGANLKIAGNFAMGADDTITLLSNGTNWYEVSRSNN